MCRTVASSAPQKYALPRLCVGTPWSVPLLASSVQALLTGTKSALDNCSKSTRQETLLRFVSNAASSVHVYFAIRPLLRSMLLWALLIPTKLSCLPLIHLDMVVPRV